MMLSLAIPPVEGSRAWAVSMEELIAEAAVLTLVCL